MIDCFDPAICARIADADRLWLFLDYDGTLADFAPTPDDIFPDAELIALLERLARQPQLRVAIISGRRLAHIQRLAPVPGILLAGTYGIEIQREDGVQVNRIELSAVRPTLDLVRHDWESLLAAHAGFYLEDKGWSLAMHAKNAEPAIADQLLPVARRHAESRLARRLPSRFRILGGDRFLEIGPTLAHKGKTVAFLLQDCPWPGALPVYLGDDDKDEEAFRVIRDAGGAPLLVAPMPRESAACCRLESPQAARRWLARLAT